jgi:hypothetical protein
MTLDIRVVTTPYFVGLAYEIKIPLLKSGLLDKTPTTRIQGTRFAEYIKNYIL